MRPFLTEADSYFQAGRYEVAAAAYQTLIVVIMEADTYDTLGIDNPLVELGLAQDPIIERYLVALQQNHSTRNFMTLL